MATIYDFVQSITSDNLPHDITHHFDQIMALYHIIGRRSDIDICTEKVNGKFGFSLLLENKESTTYLNNTLNQISFTSFGKPLEIRSNREKRDTLLVQFYKK